METAPYYLLESFGLVIQVTSNGDVSFHMHITCFMTCNLHWSTFFNKNFDTMNRPDPYIFMARFVSCDCVFISLGKSNKYVSNT